MIISGSLDDHDDDDDAVDDDVIFLSAQLILRLRACPLWRVVADSSPSYLPLPRPSLSVCFASGWMDGWQWWSRGDDSPLLPDTLSSSSSQTLSSSFPQTGSTQLVI
eukprot:3545347-Rhodomonas_salina.1